MQSSRMRSLFGMLLFLSAGTPVAYNSSNSSGLMSRGPSAWILYCRVTFFIPHHFTIIRAGSNLSQIFCIIGSPLKGLGIQSSPKLLTLFCIFICINLALTFSPSSKSQGHKTTSPLLFLVNGLKENTYTRAVVQYVCMCSVNSTPLFAL